MSDVKLVTVESDIKVSPGNVLYAGTYILLPTKNGWYWLHEKGASMTRVGRICSGHLDILLEAEDFLADLVRLCKKLVGMWKRSNNWMQLDDTIDAISVILKRMKE